MDVPFLSFAEYLCVSKAFAGFVPSTIVLITLMRLRIWSLTTARPQPGRPSFTLNLRVTLRPFRTVAFVAVVEGRRCRRSGGDSLQPRGEPAGERAGRSALRVLVPGEQQRHRALSSSRRLAGAVFAWAQCLSTGASMYPAGVQHGDRKNGAAHRVRAVRSL